MLENDLKHHLYDFLISLPQRSFVSARENEIIERHAIADVRGVGSSSSGVCMSVCPTVRGIRSSGLIADSHAMLRWSEGVRAKEIPSLQAFGFWRAKLVHQNAGQL